MKGHQMIHGLRWYCAGSTIDLQMNVTGRDDGWRTVENFYPPMIPPPEKEGVTISREDFWSAVQAVVKAPNQTDLAALADRLGLGWTP